MRRLLIALALLLPMTAWAGSARVHDNAHVMTPAQVAGVESDGSRWPFDLKFFTGTFPSPEALLGATRSCVSGPRDLCVGVDVVHHSTRVSVGTGVSVVSGDLNAIAAAGNDGFRQGDFALGATAIAERARVSVRDAVPYAPPTPTTSFHQTTTTVTSAPVAPPAPESHWFIITLFFVFAFAVVWWTVGGIGYCITQAVRSDGEVKYCYIQLNSPVGMPPVYQLYGFRPWRADRHIATFVSIDQAIDAAGKMQCTLKQQPKF